MRTDRKSLVSLGMSCQTVHQLRRLASSDFRASSPLIDAQSGPLDWLICPPQSTIQLLNQKFPDFTRNNILIRKGRAYWRHFNLYHWHGFLVTDGQQRYVDINETFDHELSRWKYLSHRFSTINPRQTVFVLSNTQNNLRSEVFSQEETDQYHFTPALLDELHHSLANYFSTTTSNIHLEVLTRRERMQDVDSSQQAYLLPRDNNEWKGSNQSWDRWWHHLHERCTRQCSSDRGEIV